MLYKSIIFTIIINHLSLVLCSDESIARLLLHKVSTTSPVVEGKPFEISYNLINNGEASAYSIQITDRYDPNSFDITTTSSGDDGSILFSIDEIPPNANKMVNITIIPRLYGIYESTRAKMVYSGGASQDIDVDTESGEIMGNKRTGYSTSLGRVKILSSAEFQKITSYYLKEWISFFGLFSVIVLVPFYLWFSQKPLASQGEKLKK